MKLWVIFVVAIVFQFPVVGQTNNTLNLEDGVALKGYDPVAYFSGQAIKGKQRHQYTYQGVIYYFSGEENREQFKKHPAAYLPQYGGWCAYAMGVSGGKVEVNPKTFKIVGGKLLLFYNAFFNNTLTSWNKDEEALMQKADLNWQKTINQ